MIIIVVSTGPRGIVAYERRVAIAHLYVYTCITSMYSRSSTQLGYGDFIRLFYIIFFMHKRSGARNAARLTDRRSISHVHTHSGSRRGKYMHARPSAHSRITYLRRTHREYRISQAHTYETGKVIF